MVSEILSLCERSPGRTDSPVVRPNHPHNDRNYYPINHPLRGFRVAPQLASDTSWRPRSWRPSGSLEFYADTTPITAENFRKIHANSELAFEEFETSGSPGWEAIYRIQHLRRRGGTLLYIPPGVYLTESFNHTSHMTNYLARDAVIKVSQHDIDVVISAVGEQRPKKKKKKNKKKG
ncbi:hypothetical protein CIPAW_05G047700 [Carya illinoinensis]|uniref:Uncharacterized protein n=1 Tax=Carya illinoinensis TaxID=32201 RepID=A0A8T1QFR0_CARIL|nr:hypothetical protein CIPAW_05G047700 [Carya illinoinensis]